MNVIEYYIRVCREDFDASDASLNLATFYLGLVQTVDADANALNIGDSTPQNDLFSKLPCGIDAAQCPIINFTVLD
jgi:hypothetical protein